MILPFLFIVALLNNIFLIAIFIIRKNDKKMPLLRKVGITYLSIFIPAAILGIILSIVEMMEPYHAIFFAIFLAFLGLEVLFDYIMKVDFRTNWKLVVPYLLLYYAMNYGMFIMSWKQDANLGSILLVLFIVQIIVNIWSHPRPGKKKHATPGTLSAKNDA